MELIILGTGYAMSTRCFNTCFALNNDGKYLLVDAGGGNGIFTQLEKANISFNNIESMFITHAHTDHLLGGIWVIRKIATLMQKGSYTQPFHVYGHDEVIHTLIGICQMLLPKKLNSYINNGIIMNQLQHGDQITCSDMQLTCFDIESTKAKQYGFTALLPNGQRLSCLGDEPYNPHCAPYVQNSNWLLAEAFCLYADKETFKPYEKNHSTARDAGKIAQELNIQNLLLYHTEDTTLETRKSRYSAEAATQFSGNIYVPDDLERISL